MRPRLGIVLILREMYRDWKPRAGCRAHRGQTQLCVAVLSSSSADSRPDGITTIPDQPFFQLYSALLALPSPPAIAPSYYRSRKHSVALAQLVLRMRRKASRRTRASKGEASAGAAEEAAAKDPAEEVVAEEGAAEDTIDEGVTEDAAPSTPSKPKPIQLPDHTPLQSDPLDTSMSDAEIEVIESCLAALEQKGGRWGEAGRRILYRKKWDQFLAEREKVTA